MHLNYPTVYESDKTAVKLLYKTMLLVLWTGLILNSILIRSTAAHNNIKVKIPVFTTSKTDSRIPFAQQLRDTRKKLRNQRRALPKINIDSWGYEDISEPIHNYNYKEIWWTNDYRDIITHKSAKITLGIHKDLRANTPPKKAASGLKKAKRTNKYKGNFKVYINPLFTNATKGSNNVTNTSPIKTPATTKLTTKYTIPTKPFIDKDESFILPVIQKDSNGQFSVLSNQNQLIVKKFNNDSNFRGSIADNIRINKDFDIGDFDYVIQDVKGNNIGRQNDENKPILIDIVKTNNIAEDLKQLAPDTKIIVSPDQSKIFPNIVKDGIYRIEIPDAVTTTPNNLVPSSPNVGNYRPFPQNPSPPEYNQPSNQGPFNPQYVGLKRPGPHRNLQNAGPYQGVYNQPNSGPYQQRQNNYNQYNPGPLRQAPFNQYGGNRRPGPYNPQGPYRQRPYNPGRYSQSLFDPRNMVQYGQQPNQGPYSPYYNPQNTYPNRQQPKPGPQPNKIRQGPEETPQPNTDPPTPQKNSNPVITEPQQNEHARQGPDPAEDDDNVPVVDKPMVEIQALQEDTVPPGLQNLILGVPARTAYIPTTTEALTRRTFEPGRGPMKENIPVYFDGPNIGRLSPYLKQLIADMKGLKMGFFSMFLINLFEVVNRMDDEDLTALKWEAQNEAVRLFEVEHLLITFGEPFVSSMESLANHLSIFAKDVIKSAASMLHYAMVNRREGVTQDINSVIDYIDSLYEEHEGVELLRAVEAVKDFKLKSGLSATEVHRKVSKALYEPVRRLAGTAKKQILIDSLNRVIENHNMMPPEGVQRRQRGNISSDYKFHYIFFKTAKTIGTTAEINRNYKITNNKRTTKHIILRGPTTKVFTRPKLKFGSTAVTKNLKTAMKVSNKNNQSRTTQHNKKETKKPKYKTIILYKPKETKNSKPKMNKTTYFIHLTRATVNNTYAAKTTKQLMPNIVMPKNKIIFARVSPGNKLNKRIANQKFIAKPYDKNTKMAQQNILRASSNNTIDTTDEEAEKEENNSAESPEIASTTMKPIKETYESSIQPKHKKGNHKHSKPPHLSKKEIRHLRHKHPKIYKKYLRHIKQSRHKSKHKSKSHKQHRKKSRQKKKTKKLKFKDIERHYEHLLKHYILRKTQIKTKINDSGELSEECLTLNLNNDTKELHLEDTFNSIEKEIPNNNKANEKVKDNSKNNTTPPNKAFENVQTTENWVHYPIVKTISRTPDENVNYNYQFNQNPAMDSPRSFQSNENFELNMNIPESTFRRSSSYSDEENALRFNLYDAMRHDKLYLKPLRRSYHEHKNKNKLRALSSYSNEEVVLKSNIYKAVGFNNSRVNFSDIVKFGSDKNKMSFRSKIKAIHEMTSYSDEEDVLKEKLKL